MRMILLTTSFMVVAVIGAATRPVEARQQYWVAFGKLYPDLKETAEMKCGECHGKNKKNRNNYGESLGKALDAKNVKDVKIIEKALKKIEEEESATEGKTFGDLLEAGKLPGEAIE
ncbi:MAG: hypothetical protein WEB58_21540 [Planctomycetaceae bacterium]